MIRAFDLAGVMTGAVSVSLAALVVALAMALCLLGRAASRDKGHNGTLTRLLRRRGRKLAEILRLFDMAEEIANLGVWQYWPDDGRQEWSAGMKGLFGLDPQTEMLPGDAETILAANGVELVGQVMSRRGRKGTFNVSFSFNGLDGQEREFRMRACHVRQGVRARPHVVGVLFDVTDIARREKRLRQSQEIAVREAKKARRLAETDPLTGLANRRRVMTELDRLVMRSRDGGEMLSLIIFDIDHFKRVNDTFGHPAGDEVLQTIARIAAQHARAGDLLGRIGGEEFICVAPGADQHLAGLIAERLWLAIAMESAAGAVPPVTVSLGIASCEEGDTALSLFARADRALYQAKESGRNRARLAA